MLARQGRGLAVVFVAAVCIRRTYFGAGGAGAEAAAPAVPDRSGADFEFLFQKAAPSATPPPEAPSSSPEEPDDFAVYDDDDGGGGGNDVSGAVLDRGAPTDDDQDDDQDDVASDPNFTSLT